MLKRVFTSRPLDGLKCFSIWKFLPSSTPVEYVGRKWIIWEWYISSGCKNDDSLPVLWHSITTSLQQGKLVLIPIKYC